MLNIIDCAILSKDVYNRKSKFTAILNTLQKFPEVYFSDLTNDADTKKVNMVSGIVRIIVN